MAANRLEPINLTDFTGGLNLRRDQFTLGRDRVPGHAQRRRRPAWWVLHPQGVAPLERPGHRRPDLVAAAPGRRAQPGRRQPARVRGQRHDAVPRGRRWRVLRRADDHLQRHATPRRRRRVGRRRLHRHRLVLSRRGASTRSGRSRRCSPSRGRRSTPRCTGRCRWPSSSRATRATCSWPTSPRVPPCSRRACAGRTPTHPTPSVSSTTSTSTQAAGRSRRSCRSVTTC